MNHANALPVSPLARFAETPKTWKKNGAHKLRGRALIGGFLARALHPKHLWVAAKLQAKRKANRRSFDDARLALYSQILPTDFLHYGYFDDPTRRPETISLADMVGAQSRYAELLLDLAGPNTEPVLDVGCGMGGLCRMLLARGYSPTALTPDRMQAAHVGKTLPTVPVIRSKFETLNATEHHARYGTVFTSESLQYLDLDVALPLMEKILKPGGKWVACDFFHARPEPTDDSLHEWQPFLSRLHAAGWKVTYERDVTPHMRPTLAYIHMWATRFGVPLMHFAFLRLRRKQPAVHHLLENVFGELDRTARKNIDSIDPEVFEAEKRYMLMVIKRA